MSVAADDDAVVIWSVYEDASFSPWFVAQVEAEFVARVEFPCALVLLEWEREEVAELVAELVVSVDACVGLGVLDRGEECMWVGDVVVEVGPVLHGV